jgi:transposase-like protein
MAGKSILDADHFKDEAAAHAWVEARVWPNGRVCPHCGVVDQSGALKGKSTRVGVYKCYACRKPFTVKVGTIFEDSKIKLHIWLQAMFLIASSKKGISSNQLSRTLGVTLKSAWFMSHRIREAMFSDGKPPMGGGGGAVEIDETYYGMRDGAERAKSGTWHLNAVVSLVDRTTGEARSFVVEKANMAEVSKIIRANVAKETKLITDESRIYDWLPHAFDKAVKVNHSKNEWVSRVDPIDHTNTVEGYYSIFKRGMRGVYQHCSTAHLHRYVAEFDFRYTNRVKLGVDDVARFTRIVEGVVGKRLTYRSVDRQEQVEA